MESSCGVKSSEFDKIILKVNKLRAESESHEIEGNKRRGVALPEQVKWLIRLIFRPSTLPKSLVDTLDNLEKSGVAVDKSAIVSALPAL
jgi:hypothetical protein